jgi:hypothetical protein
MDSGKNFLEQIKNKVKSETKSFMEKLKEVKESGIDPDEALAQIKEFKKSKNFFMVVGDVYQKANTAVRSGDEKSMTDMEKNFHRAMWDDFIDAQTHCDAFLNNFSDVREWIVMKSWKENGFTDEMFEAGNPGMLDRLRNGSGWEGSSNFRGWKRVAWTFHVAEMVEEKHGVMTCTKELLFQTWKEINSDAYLERFFGSLSEDEINLWKLIR